MRIRSIKVREWRNFQNISLHLEEAASLVCIVGPNGSGKSHLLELIAASAHRVGLSQGIEIPRGDPFADRHDFELQFYLAPGVSETVDESILLNPGWDQWDRTIKITSKNTSPPNFTVFSVGGIPDPNQSAQFASSIIQLLGNSKEVHFLSLDADRAYPKKAYNIHEIAQAYEIDWETSQYTRGSSFKKTATLYDEWIKYFLAQENQSGTRLIQATRRAREQGATEPQFQDHFAHYVTSLQKVMPHLLFTGVDLKKRTIVFDTTGLELSFDQLSGGEREIAFLIGQIDRFRLREGLFLIDEPELHLNSDLIRTWVAYLARTVSVGQVWLATHSLEAVEAAGQQATFILERNEQSRKVDSVARLDARPVLSALSRAVGTPAFSISRLSFVFVEGEETLSERERFRKLTDVPQDVRFMECGSCNEVVRRVTTVNSLAREAGSEIRIGGVVDRDFRSDAQVKEFEKEWSIFVLPVHEVENLFLHPGTLATLMAQNGRAETDPSCVIRDAADARAGCWIFQYAMATPNAALLPKLAPNAKDRAKSITWAQLASNRDGCLDSVADAMGFEKAEQEKIRAILTISANAYQQKRNEIDLWKCCEGKQVLNDVARACGFTGAPAYQLAVFSLWNKISDSLPEEVQALRRYILGL